MVTMKMKMMTVIMMTTTMLVDNDDNNDVGDNDHNSDKVS